MILGGQNVVILLVVVVFFWKVGFFASVFFVCFLENKIGRKAVSGESHELKTVEIPVPN